MFNYNFYFIDDHFLIPHNSCRIIFYTYHVKISGTEKSSHREEKSSHRDWKVVSQGLKSRLTGTEKSSNSDWKVDVFQINLSRKFAEFAFQYEIFTKSILFSTVHRGLRHMDYLAFNPFSWFSSEDVNWYSYNISVE